MNRPAGRLGDPVADPLEHRRSGRDRGRAARWRRRRPARWRGPGRTTRRGWVPRWPGSRGPCPGHARQRGARPARYQSRTPRIPSGVPRTSMYSSTDDSGTPANIARITCAVAGEEQLLHLAAGRAHDLAHVAGPLVLAVACPLALALARAVGVGERGRVRHRRDRERLDPIRVVAAEGPRHAGAGVVAHDVERVEPEGRRRRRARRRRACPW